MDWQTKFYSIVRETDDNLIRAKNKLTNRCAELTNSLHEPSVQQQHALRSKFFSSSLGAHQNFMGYHTMQQLPPPSFASPLDDLNMSAAAGVQILHMQEQIDAQKQTIMQLEKLVRTLDNERDFYKQQISMLRGEVDGLSDKMRRQFSLNGCGNQMSRIKQDVVYEINKIKDMLHNQSRDNRGQQPLLSARLDDELWSVKENLTESLEHIKRELNIMNKRIDRMESGAGIEPAAIRHGSGIVSFDKSIKSSQFLDRPTKYGHPYTAALDSGIETQQLRSTINFLKTKVCDLEGKMEKGSSLPQPPAYSSHTRPTSSLPYFMNAAGQGPFLQSSVGDYDDNDDNLSSLSDLDDSLSGIDDCSGADINDDDNDDEHGDDIDKEIDAIIKRTSDKTGSEYLKSSLRPGKSSQSSIYRRNSYKDKTDFDLSDLDLSDVEAADIDFDTLDL